MDRLSLVAYVASLALLFGKMLAVSLVQGRHRLGTKVFRWPEDAAAFGGTTARGPEAEPVERAQASLRNDGETQTFFYVVGLVWVQLGAEVALAAPAFTLYTALRFGHARLMLRAVQPLRNRVYALGQLVLLAMLVDALRRALANV